MGVGIIGVSSSAAESLPMGATSVVTEGFSARPIQNLTVSLSPGTYLVNANSQDGTPVFFYAPNSRSTAIAKGDAPAVLRVTTAETQLRITAVPTVIDNPFANITFGPVSDRSYEVIGVDYNPTTGVIVMAIKYQIASTNYFELWSSSNGVDWGQRVSTTNQLYWVKYFPQFDTWAAKYNTVAWSSSDGASWTSGANTVFEYVPPVYEATSNKIYAAGENGLQVYNNVVNWRTNTVFNNSSGQTMYNLSVVGSNSVVAIGSSRTIATTNGASNFTGTNFGGDINQWESFESNGLGAGHVRGNMVWANRSGNSDFVNRTLVVAPNGSFRGGGDMDMNFDNGVYNSSSNQTRAHRIIGPREGVDRGVVFGQQNAHLTASIDGISFFPVGKAPFKSQWDSSLSFQGSGIRYEGGDGYAWHSSANGANRLGNKFGFKVYATNFTTLA